MGRGNIIVTSMAKNASLITTARDFRQHTDLSWNIDSRLDKRFNILDLSDMFDR